MKQKHILVTGGAGYVGSVLVPYLLNLGHKVVVLDTFWFWDDKQAYINFLELSHISKNNKNLIVRQGDITDRQCTREIMRSIYYNYNVDIVINLACISNDVTSDLNYSFTHNNSYGGVMNIIDSAKRHGVEKFIQASSSSVYGSTEVPEVVETLIPKPITQYSKIKLEIEHYLMYLYKKDNFPCVILRPSTICGYSPRQRLDLIVNILASQAALSGEITVFGGDQYRPGVHIKDMVRAYGLCLTKREAVGNIYNIGGENFSVASLAKLVQKIICDTHGHHIKINTRDIDDMRSYRLCSTKIEKELGFKYQYCVKEAIIEVYNAIINGQIKINNYCYNLKTMKDILV